MRGAGPLRPPGVYAGLAAPAPPDAGAPREHGLAMLGAPGKIYARTIVPAPTNAGAPPRAPGDFLPDEKVTKESPRGDTPLGTPPEGDASLPLRRCRTPSIGFQPLTQTDLPL